MPEKILKEEEHPNISKEEVPMKLPIEEVTKMTIMVFVLYLGTFFIGISINTSSFGISSQGMSNDGNTKGGPTL